MFGKSVINIVANPIRLWLLKLEALVTPNSGWKDATSRHGKMVLVRVHGNNYLYISPYAKSGFINEFNVEYEPSRISWMKTLVWKALDSFDTIATRVLRKIKSWFRKKRGLTVEEQTSPYTFAPIEIDNSFMKKRKKTIDKIKNGKLSKRIDTLNKSEFTGKIPKLKDMDTVLRSAMKNQMQVGQPPKDTFVEILSKYMDDQTFDNAIKSPSIAKMSSKWNIDQIKKGSLAHRIKNFDETAMNDSIPALKQIDEMFKGDLKKSMRIEVKPNKGLYGNVDLNSNNFESK